ncbi:MAG TPA: CDP-glucose 4,6-dehydratase [Smithellaceae bacterium]|nr:CDP-glucose 4,6-dehydratase [Smithellaceae bacterium]
MRTADTPSTFLDNFYRGKSVLVTGDTGFKGSWLALWLSGLGASVTGLALPASTRPSHFDLAGLDHLMHHIDADVRDEEAVRQAFEISRPEIVFHLAAQALVRDSYDDPKATFDTNIGGTVNVLEAIRHCSTVRAAVVVTSDKCYDNKEWIWGYRENDSLGGHDPYSASKGAAEIVCAAYRRSYFGTGGMGPRLGLATARAGNVIGGGDWARDRIIPDCIRALSQNEPIIIRNPQSTRPWQHVLDPLHGYLMLAAYLWNAMDDAAGAWNFGPRASDQITVLELARRFVTGWGTGHIQTSPESGTGKHEAHLLHLNTDKAAFELQWAPVLDSSAAIDWTVQWYKAWYENQDILQNVSIRQIRNFQKLASNGGRAS